ncbi:UDP-glucose 4-epimerase [Paucilactobacillus oligofermentans DSM 15707 = LMG 22743]|uniref:UDP-glucose 4-epimerase n=1 Tax=Paucilactobacillus oligofermentans DSM 15707 = LMG 22743 TaxID=1423778 RepID=A0A0R1RHY9_9LACO|nr:UDP-glucose 4-epimerase GalE [Paucilactobacillus oligofermentans]KRL55993.1 UDP-glucose 4-epimerase [Paucilactobacillus oligofermentans DSM 15707 = LMG 22743]CUS26025.1 UDP-glucose 4-epimerase GalE [Paucilactobacillus oligofermentans DSM 15707 = LMG 22743]
MTRKVLITGGAGYIGSHTAKELLNQGYIVIIVDNLVSGSIEAVDPRATFYEVDITNDKNFSKILAKENVDAIMHFACAILESNSDDNPAKYYEGNVYEMTKVLTTIANFGINKIMFASTASVYGNNSSTTKATENTLVTPISSYAETKYAAERLLYWMSKKNGWNYVILRYFNVAGAEMDGSNGLRTKNTTNIISNINKVELEQEKELEIFGDNYPTEDGTCIRDYIHILDLVKANTLGIKYLFETNESNLFNLGSDKGFSVKNIVDRADELTGKSILYRYVNRRNGDPVSIVADSEKAKSILNWETKYSMDDIISSDFNWQKKNKNG